jgi:hypothetical protein
LVGGDFFVWCKRDAEFRDWGAVAEWGRSYVRLIIALVRPILLRRRTRTAAQALDQTAQECVLATVINRSLGSGSEEMERFKRGFELDWRIPHLPSATALFPKVESSSKLFG